MLCDRIIVRIILVINYIIFIADIDLVQKTSI